MRFKFRLEDVIFDFMNWFSRTFLVKLCIILKITPNMVTAGNFVFFGSLFFVLMAHGGYWWQLASLVVLFVYALFDCLDGELARATGMSSPLGAWLDNRCDFMLQIIVLVAVSVNVARSDYGVIVMVASLSALASQSVLVHYTDMFGGLFNRRTEFWNDVDKAGLSVQRRVIAHIVSADSPLMIFFFTFRYPLMLAIITNKLIWFLGYIAFVQFLRAFVLHCSIYWSVAAKGGLGAIIRSYAIENGMGPWPEYDVAAEE